MPPSEPCHGTSAAHLQQCLAVERPLLRALGAAASLQTRLSTAARPRPIPALPCPGLLPSKERASPNVVPTHPATLLCNPGQVPGGSANRLPHTPTGCQTALRGWGSGQRPFPIGRRWSGHRVTCPRTQSSCEAETSSDKGCDRVTRAPSGSLTSASPAEGLPALPRGSPRPCPHPAGDQARE